MFYYQNNGESMSQVERIDAENWEEAKKAAWQYITKGDVVAECNEDAIENLYDKRYKEINEKKCKRYAFLEKGVWIVTPTGEEDFREDIYYFSDDEEELLDKDGNPYDFDALEN